MIHSKDRSGWFGASDTAYIMGNWETATFARWWAVKLGITSSELNNKYIKTGNAYEGKILDYIGIAKRDRQIRIRKYRLRVNLDGENRSTVYEVKTHKNVWKKVLKSYWQQAQVEMFATGKKLKLIAYMVTDEEYKNHFCDIDPDRIKEWDIEYDEEWITTEYLPRLKYLAHCLRKKITPTEGGFLEYEATNN